MRLQDCLAQAHELLHAHRPRVGHDLGRTLRSPRRAPLSASARPPAGVIRLANRHAIARAIARDGQAAKRQRGRAGSQARMVGGQRLDDHDGPSGRAGDTPECGDDLNLGAVGAAQNARPHLPCMPSVTQSADRLPMNRSGSVERATICPCPSTTVA